MRAEDILYFWFIEAGEDRWWTKSKTFDDLVRRRFETLYQRGAVGELGSWRATPRGRLAEIIVLDQFPRNMYRNDARAFAVDPLALVLSQEAVGAGTLDALTATEQSFLLMPYMHSESQAIHEEAVKLFSRPGLEDNLKFEHAHKDIIDRFGRYPHRNDILERVSTAEECAFLQQPGSSF